MKACEYNKTGGKCADAGFLDRLLVAGNVSVKDHTQLSVPFGDHAPLYIVTEIPLD